MKIWIGVAALSMLAATAWADDREVSYDVYGDWRAIVTQVTGGEETWRTCRAVTGGDGDPVLEIAARQYDAGPPHLYPPATIHEYAPRGYNTLMKDGDAITFVFDDGDSYPAVATAGFDDDGFRFANAAPGPDAALYVLQGMRRAGALDITAPGGLVYSASLRGFTAAYGKIAEACEFSTMGVITPSPDGGGDGGDAGDDGAVLFEEHGVWRIQAEDFESDGAMIRECYASIPADTARRLNFAHNSLEATPPDSYPPLILSESVADTAAPMAQTGSYIQFAYDTGLILPGEVMTDTEVEGVRYVDLAVRGGYRDLALREMRRAVTLWVYADSQVIYQTALNGFAETYGDMARVCEFSTKGVLD